MAAIAHTEWVDNLNLNYAMQDQTAKLIILLEQGS